MLPLRLIPGTLGFLFLLISAPPPPPPTEAPVLERVCMSLSKILGLGPSWESSSSVPCSKKCQIRGRLHDKS